MTYNLEKGIYPNSSNIDTQPKRMTKLVPGPTAFAKHAKAIEVYSADGSNTSVTFEDAYEQVITLASVPNGWRSSVQVGKVIACGGSVYALED